MLLLDYSGKNSALFFCKAMGKGLKAGRNTFQYNPSYGYNALGTGENQSPVSLGLNGSAITSAPQVTFVMSSAWRESSVLVPADMIAE